MGGKAALLGLFIWPPPGIWGWDTKEFVIDAILCSGDSDPTKSTSPGGNNPEPGPFPEKKNQIVMLHNEVMKNQLLKYMIEEGEQEG